MSLSKLTLNPQECHALLEAVVDCDHDLYKRIKDCAKTYSDNLDAHLFEQKAMEKFKKIVSIDRIEIKNSYLFYGKTFITFKVCGTSVTKHSRLIPLVYAYSV